MDSDANIQSTLIEDTFDRYLQMVGKGVDGKSGSYRRNAKRELYNFLDWLSRESDSSGPSSGREISSPTVDDLSSSVFRGYAYHLSGDRGLQPNTVRTYYAYISSWCGWCKREDLIETHHADTTKAKEPLPADDNRMSGDQQMWSSTHRNLLTRHMGKEVDDAINQIDMDESSEAIQRARFGAMKAHRNRVLVYFLCYTGFRVGEFVRDGSDTRRSGVTWSDVSFENETLYIFRKSQKWQYATLTKRTVEPLRLYRNRIDPPSDDWPVFPAMDNGTLSGHIQSALMARGHTADEIEDIRDQYFNDFFCAMDLNVTPPSITTDGVRHIMRQITEESEVDTTKLDAEYLQPHGGRRGMGEPLFTEYGYTEAARYLDNSEEMVRERYSHIKPGKLGDTADDAIENIDK